MRGLLGFVPDKYKRILQIRIVLIILIPTHSAQIPQKNSPRGVLVLCDGPEGRPSLESLLHSFHSLDFTKPTRQHIN